MVGGCSLVLSDMSKPAFPHGEFNLLETNTLIFSLAAPYASSQALLPYRTARAWQNVLGARDGQLGMGWAGMDQELLLAVEESHTE